jgi:hypothetical protein
MNHLLQKFILISFVLIFLSCDGLFHDDDNKYQNIDNRQEKIDILNGIYARLVRVHDYNYLTALARSDDVNVYINYHFSYGDPITPCAASGGSIDFAEITGNIYVNLYAAIINANR